MLSASELPQCSPGHRRGQRVQLGRVGFGDTDRAGPKSKSDLTSNSTVELVPSLGFSHLDHGADLCPGVDRACSQQLGDYAPSARGDLLCDPGTVGEFGEQILGIGFVVLGRECPPTGGGPALYPCAKRLVRNMGEVVGVRPGPVFAAPTANGAAY